MLSVSLRLIDLATGRQQRVYLFVFLSARVCVCTSVHASTCGYTVRPLSPACLFGLTRSYFFAVFLFFFSSFFWLMDKSNFHLHGRNSHVYLSAKTHIRDEEADAEEAREQKQSTSSSSRGWGRTGEVAG